MRAECGRHNAFLRQWNRITILAQARIHLIVQFCAKNQPRERMKFLFVLSTVRENMLQALDQLVKASPLADYFRLVPVKTEALSQQLAWDYSHEAFEKNRAGNAVPIPPPMPTPPASSWCPVGRLRRTPGCGICSG